jgi:arsenate reductase-like glutaredoxin family protein
MGDESSSSNEWIELYNSSDKNISLNQWTLKISETKIIKLDGSIPPQGFYLLSRNKNQENVDLFFNKALNNNGETLQLLDNNNTIVDFLDFSEGWPYGDNKTKQTMEKTKDEWQTSLEKGGTPKKENSFIEKELETNTYIPENSNNYTILFSLILSFVSGGTIVFIKKLLP